MGRDLSRFGSLTGGITEVILARMKTAVSIPDSLFAAAEAAAKELRMSRSQLYATALAEYLETHQAEAVTEALDRVYEEDPPGLDPTLAKIQYRSLPRDDW